MYEEFKEDCPICNSPAARVVKDEDCDYEFLYLKCDDCGSETGTNALLQHNIKSRQQDIL